VSAPLATNGELVEMLRLRPAARQLRIEVEPGVYRAVSAVVSMIGSAGGVPFDVLHLAEPVRGEDE